MMEIQKIKKVEEILKQYEERNNFHFCYQGEEIGYGFGEIIIQVLDNHYCVYILDRRHQSNICHFEEEDMVIYYIANYCRDNLELYHRILEIINLKENKILMTDLYELTMSDVYDQEEQKEKKLLLGSIMKKI